MGASTTIHQPANKPAYPTLQSDRPISESAETEDYNQIVWQSLFGCTNSDQTAFQHIYTGSVHTHRLWRLHFLVRTPYPRSLERQFTTTNGQARSWNCGWEEPRSNGDISRDSVRSTTVSPLLPEIVRVISCMYSIGTLRFRKPEPPPSYTGRILATQSGSSCPQIPPKLVPPKGLSEGAIGYTKMIRAAYPDSEDCKFPL